MLVRRFSLIVPVLVVAGAAGIASAQPTQAVGPWSTLERVGESLQDRQERKDEVVGRVEETYPEFYARNAEQLDQPLLLTPMRLAGWSLGSATVVAPAEAVESQAPAAPPAPPAAPTRSRFVPYQPLVLGAFFGGTGITPTTTSATTSTPKPSPAPKPAAGPVSAPKPSPAPAPRPTPARSTLPRQVIPPPRPASEQPADAYLNFSDGPFPGAESLADGSPSAWHQSPVVADLLGRAPNPQEQQGFKADVLAKVEDRFRSSGIDVDLTIDPEPAAHTLSIVSGALAKDNPEAIGLADIGGDGFTFLDNFDTDAIDSVDDLETAVANNISHELMHTFGIDFHHESGETIDSGTIRWDLLADDDLAFSQDAVALLSSADFQDRWDDLLLAGAQLPSHGQGCSCHPNAAHATPEPATLAMWAITLIGASWSGRRWRRGRG